MKTLQYDSSVSQKCTYRKFPIGLSYISTGIRSTIYFFLSLLIFHKQMLTG